MIVNDEYKKLLDEIKSLKEQLLEKITTQDRLIYHTCKALECEYVTKLGVYEYKIFEFQCKILRIKRKIELIQSKLNRGEPVIIFQIDKILDDEFNSYKEKLESYYENINMAIDFMKAETLSDEDMKEFKKMYRAIVKKLHPDLNQNLTDKEKELFLKTVEAYESGDISTLRVIYAITIEIIDSGEEKILSNSIEKLKIQKSDLIKQIEQVVNNIEKIKNSFPYNQKDLLSNETLMKEKIEEYKADLDYCKEIYSQYNKKLDEMLGGKYGTTNIE